MAATRRVIAFAFGAVIALFGPARLMSSSVGSAFEERLLPNLPAQAEPQGATREARLAAALRGFSVPGLLDRLLEDGTGDIHVGMGTVIDETPLAPTFWQTLAPRVCKKPLIAIGQIGAPTSGLIDDGSGVYSVRPFLIERAISTLAVPDLRPGLAVAALHYGGTVMVGDRRVSFAAPDGGFDVGARYLLIFDDFLAGTDVFVTRTMGFRFDGRNVVSMNSSAFTQSRGLDPNELIAQFNEAVARMPQSCTVVKGK